MVDNLTLPACSSVLASDDIAGVHHQRVKLSQGADGAAVDVSAAAPLAVVQQDPGDATRQAEMDSIFKAPFNLDVAHHEIHEGDSFNAFAEDLTLAAAATLIIAFKTAAGTKRAHFVKEFQTLTGGTLELIEGPTWDNQSGTLCPVFNRKREVSMNSSTFLEDSGQAAFTATDNLILNPTTLAGGTSIFQSTAFGVKNRFAGGGGDRDEWILKPDTQYAVLFTSSAASNMAEINLRWYEHTDE